MSVHIYKVLTFFVKLHFTCFCELLDYTKNKCTDELGLMATPIGSLDFIATKCSHSKLNQRRQQRLVTGLDVLKDKIKMPKILS